ncbi:restriction endonuclease subunit S [Citrobacter sp. RHBSTW-00089]|uniref:restriction endonuclease subunit S n=1 Tax=Citrobacter sp. RHBSTW-00089 TaxID=2742633 RepID=UPI0015FC66DE|nr:restriction endonuclease subunit S [Citrobacter sp. RHBSTW-00089]MBA8085875.1 restriction endonuclease subunit S [Citrobacter sp. RHBSTW-00089]
MAKYKAYPQYKDSGVEWLGEIPLSWDMWKLSHAYEVIGSGTTPTSNNESWFQGNILWVTTGELRETVIYNTSKNISLQTLQSFPALKVHPVGSIIIAMYGATIGRLGILGVDATTNQACCAMTKSNVINNKYLYYWLQTFRMEIINLSSGGGQPNINQEKVASLKISSPSIKDQILIAAFLDHETTKIDNLIEKQQQLIELLKEKRQAVISNAVTKGLNPDVPMKDSGVEWVGEMPSYWRISKLRFMFNFGKGLTITKENLQDEGIPCISYGEVHSKYGFEVSPKLHSLKCVDEKYLKDNSGSLLSKGDIIFADTSEDIDGSGNFSQLITDDIVFAGYHTIIAKPFNRKNWRFYAYLLDCKELRTQVRHAVKGVKVFSITQAILRGLSIWLPTDDEQKNIAKFLDHETTKIDNLIEKQQ